MKDLLYAIAAGLVEDKTAIIIKEDEPDEEGTINFRLSVAPDDMGRVIGKQGRIAKASPKAPSSLPPSILSISLNWKSFFSFFAS